MPIKPENKGLYPKEWPQIRARILERAHHRCEECGVPNYAILTRPERRVVSDREARAAGILHPERSGFSDRSLLHRLHWTRVILTIAHLDHDPQHNDEANLRALCQLHHNKMDREHRAATRAHTRAQAMHRKMAKNYAGWQQPLNLKMMEETDATAQTPE